MIVLDTHALLWWALDPQQLSLTASNVLAEMERKGGFASAISVWELGVKVRRGKLELPLPIEEFAARIERGGVVKLLPVGTDIWLHSLSLAWDHTDPADRVIVSTATLLGVPLLTKDTKIHDFLGPSSVW
ncbi:MAG: type II toxin-antitoxin system VapC family toxin [Polyangiaceae bacterium]|nr:type II toxin-antitoxin system VapC family toxin [Polyangiaceae bacterium]